MSDSGLLDLIVVGGGPAGSSAARAGALAGLDVLLIEKEEFPRYKACGGALSEKTLSYLGFPLPKDIIEREVTGARIFLGGSSLEMHKPKRIVTLITRSNFDNLLLEKAIDAGASVRQGEKVESYEDRGDHVCVRTPEGVYRSKFLAVCGGYKNDLKDDVRGHDGPGNYGLCMVADVDAGEEEIDSRLHNSLEFHFGVASMGYGWVFPHRRYFSVGMGGLAGRMTRPRETLEKFLRENGFNGSYRLRGHAIPFADERRKVAEGRVLLAGDSAGFVDPFTGEGIAYAVRSGQIAAETVSSNINDGLSDPAAAYGAVCREEFGEELRRSRWLARLMHIRPEIFLRVLAEREDVLGRYLDVAAGRVTYREFIRWLLPRMPGYLLR